MKKIDKSKIPVVILCGGKGTRLKEETEIIPKPLVKIGDRPILWHIMKIYHAYGFNKFILPVGYKGEKIKEYFYNYPIFQSDFTIDLNDAQKKEIIFYNPTSENWQITIVDSGLEAMTASRIKKIEKFINNEFFLLTYGDGVSNINLNELLSFHLKKRKLITVTAVRPPARFGEIVINGKGECLSFFEKPQIKAGYINGGFFVIQKDIFKLMPIDEKLSFEKDVLPKIANKKDLAVFCHNGYWQCMDTIRDVELLNEQWASGRAPWKIWK